MLILYIGTHVNAIQDLGYAASHKTKVWTFYEQNLSGLHIATCLLGFLRLLVKEKTATWFNVYMKTIWKNSSVNP